MSMLSRLVLTALVFGFSGFPQAQAVSPVSADSFPSADVFVQTGHAMSSTALAFSPDSRRLVSCDGVGHVIAWDLAAGLQYRALQRHVGMCLGVSFTADGEFVYTSGGASSGQTISLSRYRDGQVLREWNGHSGLIVGLRSSRQNDGFWSLGEKDGLWRWTRTSPVPAARISLMPELHGQASVLAMNAEQSIAWVGTRSGKVLRVALASGEVSAIASLPGPVSAIDVHPVSGMIAVALGDLKGSNERAVLLLDPLNGSLQHRLEGHEGNVFALAFSPDGATLLSAAQIDLMVLINGGVNEIARHESLRVWDMNNLGASQVLYNTRNAHGTPFLRGQLAFSPDGRHAGLSLWDEAVRVFSPGAAAEPWRQVQTLEGRGVAARQISASMQTLAVSNGRARVAKPAVYLKAEQVLSELLGGVELSDEQKARIALLYSERGFSRYSQVLSIWDLNTGRLTESLDWQLGPTATLTARPDGAFSSLAPLFPHTITVAPLKPRLLRQATLNAKGTLDYAHFSYERGLGAPAGALLTQEETGAARVAGAMAVGGDQTHYAIAGSSTNKLADVPQHTVAVLKRDAKGSLSILHEIPVGGPVLKMAFDPLGKVLWVSSTQSGLAYSPEHQGLVQVFDTSTARVLASWPLAKGITTDELIVHPSGVSAAGNGSPALLLWTLSSAKANVVPLFKGALRHIKALALSQDGKRLAVSNIQGDMAVATWGKNNQFKSIWRKQLTAPAAHLLTWAQGDKTLAVAAEDGSIRLLDAAQGAEQIRLFQFDNGEWISILPQGYFSASGDGDQWVNVRMNGAVYGIKQFYDVFYRPDLVQRQLAREPVSDLITVTLQDAIQRPPPRVEVSPATLQGAKSGDRVRLLININNAGGGIGEVRISHNGKLVDVTNKAILRLGAATTTPALAEPGILNASPQVVTRALRVASRAQVEQRNAEKKLDRLDHSTEIELTAGINELAVSALNSAGDLGSRPVSIQIAAKGDPSPGKLWLLAVGINQFKEAQYAPALAYAVKDAQDFSKHLAAGLSSALGAQSHEVIELINEKADQASLSAALNRIQASAKPEDAFVWFVASHGTLDSASQYGMVLHDWNGKAEARHLFSSEQLLDATRRIKALRQVVILDTCHAGGVQGWMRGLYDARFSVLARNMGLHMFASASETQEALDGYQNNGLFTHNLLKGVEAAAADNDDNRRISVIEWGGYAQRETSRIAKLLRHRQEPMLMNFGKDITVYELK